MRLAIPTGHDTLGLPLPSSLHAIAVSCPKWSDVVGFRKEAQNAEYGEEFIRNRALLAGKRKSESSAVSSSQRPCRIANHALAQTL